MFWLVGWKVEATTMRMLVGLLVYWVEVGVEV